ncbi:MAG: ATP-binding protein [Candidatus Zixiibacteriota bacterium]
MVPIGDLLKDLPKVLGGQQDGPPTSSAPDSSQSECPVCQGYHFVHPLKDNGRPDYSVVVPCSCVEAQLEQEKRQRIRRACELPAATAHMTFEKFIQHRGTHDAYSLALALAEETGSANWLTINSDSDRGKTHLLIAICRRWLERGLVARYAYVPLLLEELRRGFRKEGDDSYEARFDFFLNVPLLALDDLGAEDRTPWVQEKLDTIIDYRLVTGLALAVTTNCPLSEIPFRMSSRLKRGGQVVIIDTKTYSEVKEEGLREVDGTER